MIDQLTPTQNALPIGGGASRLRVQRPVPGSLHDDWETIPRTFNVRQAHNLLSAADGVRRIHPDDAAAFAAQREVLGL